MKLAITGKGGTGKTTLSVLLARSFAKDGKNVILVDADPATNLATTLGIPNSEEITPISEMRELIEERALGTSKLALGTHGACHDVCPPDCCPSGRGAAGGRPSASVQGS